MIRVRIAPLRTAPRRALPAHAAAAPAREDVLSLQDVRVRRFSTRASGLLALASVLALAACGGAEPVEEAPWSSPIPFDTARAWIHAAGGDSVPLLIELAESDAQRQFGLMTRPTLDDASGMAFVYEEDQPADAGFYMYRTRIPLDIAFLDGAGVVDTILAMTPCASPYPESCPIYEPGVNYRTALEVNQGWFERHEVRPGARVRIDRSQQNPGLSSP